MGGVDDQCVHADVDEQLGPVERIGPHTQRGGHAQAAVGVLGCLGVVHPLLQVLDGDQAAQPAARIDDGKLFDFVAGEQHLGLIERGALRSGHQRQRRHHLGDQLGVIGLEAQVAVGEDADE